MKNNVSIFRQLILNIIIPVVVALLALGILNYNNTISILKEADREKQDILIDEIKNILEFEDYSLELLEESMDKEMRKYSDALINQYFISTKDIETADLASIRHDLGMNPLLQDIYIINTKGIVVNTTFEKDLGLDFFSFGEHHKNYLLGILDQGEFVNERFSIESNTKKLKKYSYQPTKDSEYIIEIGFYSTKATNIVESFKSHLNAIASKQESVLAVDMFVGEDNPVSFNQDVEIDDRTLKMLEVAFKDKINHTDEINEDGKYLHYDYIYMNRKNTNLYKGEVIRIINDRTIYNKLLSDELLKLFIVFGITILSVILLIYNKTKVITFPIKKLVDSVNRISAGNFNERADVAGSHEIANLSIKFNLMVEKLEEYYKNLEQKVIERTAEIQKQKDEIEEQKKHIMDSIHYAKRIQTAILPAKNFVRDVLPNSFLLYRPKDIVSGDFYWIDKKDDKVIVAAVDCTGHGVPGAFMSIIGHNQLNIAVNSKSTKKPSQILDKLNLGVTNALNQHQATSQVKDGMDIALCTFDYRTNLMEYAGAYNPIYLIRGGELTQINGNKHPIGAFMGEDLKSFDNHTIQLKKGDAVYIFSDGYADQFGGPKGKKFKYKNFKELLVSIQSKEMFEQKEILDETIQRWMGDIEQLDDILVIGVKI